jgi:hypothetical protein
MYTTAAGHQMYLTYSRQFRSVQVANFPTDALIPELVRSFSQQYRTLAALHSSTAAGSRPPVPPGTFGRPDNPVGLSPKSPLEDRSELGTPSLTKKRVKGVSRSGRCIREIAENDIPAEGGQSGNKSTGSEGECQNERYETLVTSNYTVELEPEENGQPTGRVTSAEMRKVFAEEVASVSGTETGQLQSPPSTSRVGTGLLRRSLGKEEEGGDYPVSGSQRARFLGSLQEGSVSSSEVEVGSYTVGALSTRSESPHGGEVLERWSFGGSTARHRKTRRRRGGENGLGVAGTETERRQLDFVGASEGSEGVLTALPDGQLSERVRTVAHSMGHRSNSVGGRSVSVGSRSVEIQLAERSVSAQEVANRLKLTELQMLNERLGLDSAGLALKSESNSVRRKSNALELEKLRARAARHGEERAGALARRCADELVAGLIVMVVSLLWAGYYYGYPNLQARLQECRAVRRPGHRSIWGRFAPQAFMDDVAGRAQVVVCQLAVAGRLGWGLLVGGFMVTMLLRHVNVAGSVRVMPSTVLLLVLGWACGCAGKRAVDR